METMLRESEQHFRTFANCGSTLIWTSGQDKLCNYFNEPWLRFTGRSLEQELGNGWTEGVHPDDFDQCLKTYITCFDQRKPFSMDYRLRHADGAYRWIRDDGNPRNDSQGEFLGYIGFCFDISVQKRLADALEQHRLHLEEQVQERSKRLHDVSVQLTLVEESERRNLALQLHDNLSQLLAAINIRLTLLVDDKNKSSVNLITNLVDQADQAARMITRQLSPPILNATGIKPALKLLTDEMERTYQLTVHISHQGETIVLAEAVEALLYRSVRELLINIAKHAQVSDVRLSRLWDGSQLLLVVSDEGCGFEAPKFHDSLPEKQGFGLRSIYECIINIGGNMVIDSCPGQGTTITLSVPFSIAAKKIPAS
jgi:PAS domain S-box-containing protein